MWKAIINIFPYSHSNPNFKFSIFFQNNNFLINIRKSNFLSLRIIFANKNVHKRKIQPFKLLILWWQERNYNFFLLFSLCSFRYSSLSCTRDLSVFYSITIFLSMRKGFEGEQKIKYFKKLQQFRVIKVKSCCRKFLKAFQPLLVGSKMHSLLNWKLFCIRKLLWKK